MRCPPISLTGHVNGLTSLALSGVVTLLVVVLSAADTRAQAFNACFSGQVRTSGLASEPGGRIPIEGATVTLYLDGVPNRTALTNSGGYYVFQFPSPSGTHHWYVRANKQGGWIAVNHSGVATGSGDLCANGGIEFNALEMAKVHVKAIGFKHDYPITKWESGDMPRQYVIDPLDGTQPTWDESNPSARFPVAYKQSTPFTMFAIVEVTPATSYPGWVATLRARINGQVVATKEFNLDVSDPSSSTPGFLDEIQCVQIDTGVGKKVYAIDWEAAGDSVGISAPEWNLAGTATQLVYWTYNVPITNPAFEDLNQEVYAPIYDRALEWACGSVSGGVEGAPEINPSSSNLVTDLNTIIGAVNRGIDTAVAYDPSAQHSAQHPLVVTETSDRAAMCSDNANLLRGLLKSIGIPATLELYYAVNPDSGTLVQYSYADRSGSDQCILNGCVGPACFAVARGAHDYADHNPHFTFHAVVYANTRRWDPSYGIDFPNLVDLAEVFDPRVGPPFHFPTGADTNAFRLVVDAVPSVGGTYYVNAVCLHSLNALPNGVPVCPTTMVAGGVYPVTISFKNTGSIVWEPADFKIVSANPLRNTTWGGVYVPVNGTFAQDQVYTVSFNVTAPSLPGSYDFQWLMTVRSEGFYIKPFGSPSPNIVVNVVPAP